VQTRLEIDFYRPKIRGLSQDNEGQSYTLSWKVLNNEASLIWLRLLYQSLVADLPFYARFSGFENSPKDLHYLSQKMNEAIEIINFGGSLPTN
jgi:hypothetical protein